MTSLIPIIKDLVPLIMGSKEIQVTPSSALIPSTAQTDGMVRKGAIVGQSDKLCASVMIAPPHSSSAIHHHGEQETIIYAASGHHGLVVSNGGKTRQALNPGDFALIPAWTEHQEVNEGGEEVTWIITRSGGEPVVVNLEGWGEGERR